MAQLFIRLLSLDVVEEAIDVLQLALRHIPENVECQDLVYLQLNMLSFSF